MAECIVLTTGCGALCDFYNISTGVWITLIYMGAENFGIKKIRSKNKKKMVLLVYNPPMRFEIDRDINPYIFIIEREKKYNEIING